MSNLRKIGNFVFSKNFLNKFIAYFLLLVFLIVFRNFIGVFLLIFIFSYLFFSSSKFIKRNLDKFFDKFFGNNSKLLKKFFSLNFIIVFIYIIFLIILLFVIFNMIPRLITELSTLSQKLPFLSDYTSDFLQRLKELTTVNSELRENVDNFFSSKDFSLILEFLKNIKSVSMVFLKFILSLFLSFIFLLDREKLVIYLEKIKYSNFKFLYKEYKSIFSKVTNSFGVVINAQASIAFVNTILTAIGLTIIGFLNSNAQFPYFLSLILIVFITGFIPIVGTFISSIPIIIIGYLSYPFRGISIVFELIILITIIHLVEAYFLNPRIVSKAISVPISITFLVLLLSEHLFGPAGLILGMSLFYFTLGLLGDIDKSIKK